MHSLAARMHGCPRDTLVKDLDGWSGVQSSQEADRQERLNSMVGIVAHTHYTLHTHMLVGLCVSPACLSKHSAVQAPAVIEASAEHLGALCGDTPGFACFCSSLPPSLSV